MERIKVSFLLLILSLVMVVGSAAGCGKKQEAEDPAPLAEEQQETEEQEEPPVSEQEQEPERIPERGGTLCVTMELQDVYNPVLVSDQEAADILELMYQHLLEYDSDGRPQPGIASSWTLSEDQLEAVLDIDTSLQWQNGDPITADDVVFTIDVIQEHKDSVYYSCVSGIENAAARDKKTVVLTFKKASPFNLYTMYFPILSQRYYGSDLEQDPMGSGPYRFDHEIPMQKLVLTANEGYAKGEPYITTVEVELTRSEKGSDPFDQKLDNLRYQDEINWGDYLSKKNVVVNTFSTGDAVFLEYNLLALNRKKDREAIAYALDSGTILHDVYLDKGEVTEIPFPAAFWYAPTNPARYGLNPQKVLELVDIDRPLQVRLLVDISDPLQGEIGDAVAKQLESQGIGVTLEKKKHKAFIKMKSEGSYDIALMRKDLSLDSHLKAMIKNIEGYDRRSFEALCDKLQYAVTEQEIHQAYAAIGTLINEDLPIYTLFFLKKAALSGNGVFGALEPEPHYVFKGIEKLYVNYSVSGSEG